MVFSSPVFIFAFLPCVLLGYYLINPPYRNGFLLLSSLFFYAWGEPKFIFVMFVSIIVNYVFGILIDRAHDKLGRKCRVLVFSMGVCANLGLLFYYKYFTFIEQNINSLLHTSLKVQNIALPIGISFFVFQSISYIIDLYRRNVPVQNNFISFALYIQVFPKILAGPIVRYTDFYLQIDERNVDAEKFAYGVQRFIIGLGKVVLIANVLGEVTDKIFATPYTQIDTATAWAGGICYMMQIFFDFSGYTDMAIGLGKMFGFNFTENFNLPYISQSITEFWRRWHISLMIWFKEYLYIPLGGNRTGNIYVNLIIVFIVTGLWHGAAWTFLYWGLWHGMFIIIERLFKNLGINVRVPSVFKWMYTMFVVLIGWVLFRSDGIINAYHYLQAMFNIADHKFIRFSMWYYIDRQIIFTFIVAAIVSSSFPKFLSERAAKMVIIKNVALYVKLSYLLILMILNIMVLVNSTYSPFIYFRF